MLKYMYDRITYRICLRGCNKHFLSIKPMNQATFSRSYFPLSNRC